MKIKTNDGIELYYKVDQCSDEVGVVVLVHGIAENCHRYDYVVSKLNDAGYTVFRFDHRGHGRSGGKRGYIKSYETFNTDTDLIVDLAIEHAKGKDVFMLGHSMGGFVTALYGITYPDKLKGQILSGACTDSIPEAKGVKGFFFRVLATLFPNLELANKLDDKLTHDKKIMDDYVSDEYNLGKYTLSLVTQFAIKGVNHLKANKKNYAYPVFLVHGGDDAIVPKAFSTKFHDEIKSNDKSIKIYDGLYHEIMNEPEKDVVIEDIINWLKEHS